MVFADTSGLVALFCPRDARHRQARQAWQAIAKSGERVLTTVFVLAETVTFVRRRAGWQLSRRVGDAILKSPNVELVCPDRELLDAAWREFLRVADPKLSLCDAASFVTMRQQGAAQAFAFDAHFVDAGFALLP